MERKFDLREGIDRRDLAALLPTIDQHTFPIGPESFVHALQRVADLLRNPTWLSYQWGIVGPHGSNALSLDVLVELGQNLGRLAGAENLDCLRSKLLNPTQFHDTMFEIEAAAYFRSMPAAPAVSFDPDYNVRGKLRHPDFDVVLPGGRYPVECKCPRSLASRQAEVFKRFCKAISAALDRHGRPSGFRIEFEVACPLRESAPVLAEKLVAKAIRDFAGSELRFTADTVEVFVLPRSVPFRLSGPGLTHSTVIVGATPTGLLDPAATSVRGIRRGQQDVGSLLRDALKTLPEGARRCIIMVDGVKSEDFGRAVDRRLSDQAYDAILAFVCRDKDRWVFRYRTADAALVVPLIDQTRWPRD